MTEPVLAIADANGIHAYVFSTPELKMIRGGSALQASLNLDEMPRIIQANRGTSIYAGGGTALATFDGPAEAEKFCREVEAEFRRQTHIASVTTAWVPYTSGAFQAARARLAVELEIRKNGSKRSYFSGSQPFWVSCQACGMHPASSPNRENEKLLCRWLPPAS